MLSVNYGCLMDDKLLSVTCGFVINLVLYLYFLSAFHWYQGVAWICLSFMFDVFAEELSGATSSLTCTRIRPSCLNSCHLSFYFCCSLSLSLSLRLLACLPVSLLHLPYLRLRRLGGRPAARTRSWGHWRLSPLGSPPARISHL